MIDFIPWLVDLSYDFEIEQVNGMMGLFYNGEYYFAEYSDITDDKVMWNLLIFQAMESYNKSQRKYLIQIDNYGVALFTIPKGNYIPLGILIDTPYIISIERCLNCIWEREMNID
jgi:hypothetical protein